MFQQTSRSNSYNSLEYDDEKVNKNRIYIADSNRLHPAPTSNTPTQLFVDEEESKEPVQKKGNNSNTNSQLKDDKSKTPHQNLELNNDTTKVFDYNNYIPYKNTKDESDSRLKWEVDKPNGEKGIIYGPYATQEDAQHAYILTIINDEGFIKDLNIKKKHIKKLEIGDMIKVNAVVLHRTESSDYKSALSSFEKGVGTHFLISKDGTIYQTASLQKFTYHVGKNIRSKTFETKVGSEEDIKEIQSWGWNPSKVNAHEREKEYPDRYPTSIDAIGIEVVGKYDYNKKTWEMLTEEQVESTSQLVNIIKEYYGLDNTDLYKHEEISYKTPNEGQVVYDAIKDKINDNHEK